MAIGKEKYECLCAEQDLQVRRNRPWWRLTTNRPHALASTTINSVRSYDFVFDACANGQQIKCLTVVDEYRRKALANNVASSIQSVRIIDVLAQLICVRGAPCYSYGDNAPEFVNLAVLKWIAEQGIECALIDSGGHGKTGQKKASTVNSETNA